MVASKVDIWSDCSKNIKNAPRVTENALDPEISISYNPNLIDLQSKLNDLGEKHLAELKKREKINKKVGKTLKTLNNRRKFQEEMAEFIDGKVGDESSAESEDESDDIIIKNIPNRYKKKTRPQRKKEMEKKLKIQHEKAKAIKKKLKKDVNNLHQIKKNMSIDKKIKLMLKNDKIKNAKKVTYKPEISILDIPMPENLKGSLRDIKPQGSFISDKFKSLYKRKFLVGGPRNKCKPKVKRIEKKKFQIDHLQ